MPRDLRRTAPRAPHCGRDIRRGLLVIADLADELAVNHPVTVTLTREQNSCVRKARIWLRDFVRQRELRLDKYREGQADAGE